MGVVPVLTRAHSFTVPTLVVLAGLGVLSPGPLRAQTPAARAIVATRPPVIDGRLNDPAWTAAPVIEGVPTPGPRARQPETIPCASAPSGPISQ